MTSSPSLILASASLRRRQLLAFLAADFMVASADIDEQALPAEAPLPHVLRLAETKAQVVASRHPQACVLAADTIVVQDGSILGKPAGPAEARCMLHRLRAATHQVITAVALAHQGQTVTAAHTSLVTMRSYSDAEIAAYIATGDPLDKAGAYAIQHPTFQPVAHFQGCFASIMGLPLGVVADLLSAAGLPPAPAWPDACARLGGSCCQWRMKNGQWSMVNDE